MVHFPISLLSRDITCMLGEKSATFKTPNSGISLSVQNGLGNDVRKVEFKQLGQEDQLVGKEKVPPEWDFLLSAKS